MHPRHLLTRPFTAVLLWWCALSAVAAQTAGDWQTITPGGDTLCADGSPYSFHVRKGDPQRLLIFLNGGGACWTGTQCATDRDPTPYVSSAGSPANDPRNLHGIFDETRSDNPLRGWTQVFVSYCTGDVHLGTRDVRYSDDDGRIVLIHHRGRSNAASALAWAYENVAHPRTVLVAGGSAGAIASPYYAALVAEHWPGADVTQFGGGSGGYRADDIGELMRMWGVFDDLPEWPQFADFKPPAATFEDLYAIAAARHPKLRLTRYDSAYDKVQEQFMAMLDAPGDLLPSLLANRDTMAERVPGLRSYIAGGTEHTLLRYDRVYDYQVDGVPVLGWLMDRIAGRPVSDVYCGSPEACRPPPQ